MNRSVLGYSKWLLLAATMIFVGWLVANAGILKQSTPELPSFNDEVRRLARVQEMSDIYVKGRIRLYDGYETTQILEQKDLEFLREGSAVWSRLDVLETILLDSFLVRADHEYRQIFISKVDSSQQTTLSQTLLLDELLKDGAEFRIHGTVEMAKGPLRRLVFANDLQPEIWKTAIEYDTGNYRLLRSENGWLKDLSHPDELGPDRPAPACWVSRTELDYPLNRPGSVKELFQQIVHRTKNGWAAAANYSGYELVDATTNQP